MISLTDENTTGAQLSFKEGYIGNLNRDDLYWSGLVSKNFTLVYN